MEPSVIDLAHEIYDLSLLMDAEMKASQQRDFDGMGCDELCGLCKPGIICWWHQRSKCQIPRKFA